MWHSREEFMSATENIINQLTSKAHKSDCKYKISAIGFDKKGELIGVTNNTHRFLGKGKGLHAEMRLIRRYGNNIKTMIICRVGRSGIMRPIDPCETCSRVATKLGIKIQTIAELTKNKG